MIKSYFLHKCKFRITVATVFNDQETKLSVDVPCRLESRSVLVNDQRNTANQDGQVMTRGVAYIGSLNVQFPNSPPSDPLVPYEPFTIRRILPGKAKIVLPDLSMSLSSEHVILNVREEMDFTRKFFMVYF